MCALYRVFSGNAWWAFGLAPSSIEFVNMYTQNYCRFVSWPPVRFLLLALGRKLTWSTHSVKLLFFQKAEAIVVIVEFMCIQDYKEWREGTYAWDKLNIWTNAPSPLLSKSSVQKREGTFSGAYSTCIVNMLMLYGWWISTCSMFNHTLAGWYTGRKAVNRKTFLTADICRCIINVLLAHQGNSC